MTETFKVTNVGAGAALNILYWSRSVDDHYVLAWEQDIPEEGALMAIAGHLLPSHEKHIDFDFIKRGQATLFVIQAEDSLGTTHQIKYLRTDGLNGHLRGPVNISIPRARPNPFDHWSAVVKRLRRRLKAIEAEADALMRE